MRKSGFLSIAWAIVVFITALANAVPGQEKQREEVTVTAVEVPVRVLHKGEMVKGLVKEDFELYENGVRQVVSGFDVVSRRISSPTEPSGAVSIKSPQPRLFILIFDVFDYTDAVGDAIDYFFEHVYREHDGILLLTENRLLEIGENKDPMVVRSDLKQTLKNYKVVSVQNIHKAYLEIQEECDRAIRMLGDERSAPPSDWDQHLNRFFDNYENVWKAYRDRFLVPDIGLYRAVVRKISPAVADKWAICFQQRDLFPQLRSLGTLDRKISTILISQIDPEGQAKAQVMTVKQRRLQESLAIDRQFPAERLKDLFTEAGITFHLILMKSVKPLSSLELELREVGESYEACFKDISRSTGGYVTFSNKAVEALQQAVEKEDYHYVLAYQSHAPIAMRGKDIRVKVLRDGVDILHLKHLQKLEGPAITVADVRTAGGALSFTLKKYALAKTNKGIRGAAEIRVMLVDEAARRVLDESKVLELVKEETHISITLPRLKAGVYFLTVEAVDRITGEKDVFSRMIEL